MPRRIYILRCVFAIVGWIIYFYVLYCALTFFQEEDLMRPFVDSDAWRHPVEHALSRGYDAEQHLVTTGDGVVLEVHRMYSRKNSRRARFPVILQHGLQCSSFVWIANLPHQSLGFLLADAGYDVWLANSRGNIYGRRSANSVDLGAHTLDHLALEDLPATIDHVLEISGKPRVHYVGHSQGGMLLLALLSEKLEYNEKICIGIGLAPVLKGSNASPLLRNLFR